MQVHGNGNKLRKNKYIRNENFIYYHLKMSKARTISTVNKIESSLNSRLETDF